MPSSDPIVDEVRAARDAIAKEFDYDIERIARAMQERQDALHGCCAEVAAANGALAVGSPAVSRPADGPGRRAHLNGLDLRRFCSQHRILGRAPTAAGPCGARLERFVLRGHGRPLRDPDGAATRSAMARRHDPHHLSLRRRSVSVDVRDLSRNVEVMRSAASLASRLMLSSPPRMS